MLTDQSYAEYIKHSQVTNRPLPAASLEFFLLDRAQQRQHRREVQQLSQLATEFGWRLVRDYEKSLNDGYTLVVANLSRSILWVSHRFFSMTGYKAQEVIGQTPLFLQGPATDPARLRQLSEELSQVRSQHRTSPIHQQLINYRKDGATYLCDIEIDPIWNTQDELTHFIALEREI
ncbi:hypothetical protein GCM10027347_27250 [Larkinella harenae]